MRKNTASFVAFLGAGVQPRPYNFSCLSALLKNAYGRFRRFFSDLACHLASKSLSWPAMPVSNKKQEFERWKRIKLFTDFWVRAYRFDFAPRRRPRARSMFNSRFSRFQFSAFWSNGLASSVFIFVPILLRFFFFIFFVYARAKMRCYRFFNFDLRKKLCFVKADRVG